jgi:hypothetical protein
MRISDEAKVAGMADYDYGARALETELRLRTLLEEEGMEPPDEVLHDTDPDELVFLWHEEKVAVVVELWNDELDGPGSLGPHPPV